MRYTIGNGNPAAAIVDRVGRMVVRDDGFQGDLLDFVRARVNRCEPYRMSSEYAKLEERSTVLMGRMAGLVDVEVGRMLDRLDGIRAVMAGMAMERAYRRGMAEGMRVGM